MPTTASDVPNGQLKHEMPSHGHAATTHAVVHDERNDSILIGMRDGVTGEFKFVPREQAVVSVFDSAFMLGDGIWEGLRSKRGVIQFAKDHLDRLYQTAKAQYMDLGVSKSELLAMVNETVDKNNMTDSEDIHIRMMISRGLKATPHQNPRFTIGLPLIVIIPEYKKPDPAVHAKGMKLATVPVRKANPDVKDEMWNHMSKSIDIMACIYANIVGADEGLMLDDRGYVKTCNSTNFMIVREGEGADEGRLVIWAPTKSNLMQGITRRKTIEVARAAGIPVYEQDFTLTEVYGAQEAFCTGTFPSQIPVTSVDDRLIGDGSCPGPMVLKLQELYKAHVAEYIAKGREAVMEEVKLSELPWAKRYGGSICRS